MFQLYYNKIDRKLLFIILILNLNLGFKTLMQWSLAIRVRYFDESPTCSAICYTCTFRIRIPSPINPKPAFNLSGISSLSSTNDNNTAAKTITIKAANIIQNRSSGLRRLNLICCREYIKIFSINDVPGTMKAK